MKIHNFTTWKQSHYLFGVMTEPVGPDMSCHCLMETKCENVSQNPKNIISDLD